MSKYSKGDVVRLNNPAFEERNGEACEVVRIETYPFEHLIVKTEAGKELAMLECFVEGVTLEEVRQYYAVMPRRGFIVDGLMVDELEAGQEEAYETFQRAAKKSKCRMALRMVEMFVTLKERFKKPRKRKRKEDP